MDMLHHKNAIVNFSDERFNPDRPPDTARVELVILALVMLDRDAAVIAMEQLRDDDMYYGRAMSALRPLVERNVLDNTTARCALSKLYGSADGAQKFIDAVNLEMVEQNASPDRMAEYCVLVNDDIRRSRSIALNPSDVPVMSDGESIHDCFEPIPDDPNTTMDGEDAGEENTVHRVLTPRDLMTYNVQDDPNALFENRWLCRGGSCFVIGSTGAGKSSIAMQASVCWALGESFFGIKPVRPLRSLVLQAENDDGDLSEMFRGVLNGLGYAGRLNEVEPMLRFVSETAKCGDDFMPWAARLIQEHKPDIAWIDPIFAFIGGNVSDQATVSKFLRNGLGAISQETNVAWIIVHHANKPPKDPKPSTGSGVNSDLSYMGSGSAELANWARAVLTLREIENSLFELRAAKRGRRAGLLNSDGQPTTEVFLAHGKTGICWERATREEAPQSADEGIIEDVLDALKMPLSGGWHAEEIHKKIREIKGGTIDGAKTFFYRKVKPHLNKPLNGIYTVKVSKFQ